MGRVEDQPCCGEGSYEEGFQGKSAKGGEWGSFFDHRIERKADGEDDGDPWPARYRRELKGDTGKCESDGDELRAVVALAEPKEPEEHVQERVEIVAEGTFEDSFVEGCPDIEEPIAREEEAGKSMPTEAAW